MTIGVVIIGRNEGQRLVTCLESVKDQQIVYVDSGSTDDSIKNAKAIGAEVVELDVSRPFTAARARNAGYEYLIQKHPDLQYIQFIDGDCEVVPSWVTAAQSFLDEKPEYAVVCGRRRERFPEKTTYNLLCDIEWNTPVGDALACGGDALYRTEVLKKVEGFDPAFIAGEEPELCFRIRQSGAKIYRIDEEMTLHDADMHSIKQWWKRSLRSGYAYALNYFKHGSASPEAFKKRELKSISFWAALMMTLFFATVLSLSLVLFVLTAGLIFAQIYRVAKNNQRVIESHGFSIALLYSASNLFAKIPQFFGIAQCWSKRRSGDQHTLVEYK